MNLQLSSRILISYQEDFIIVRRALEKEQIDEVIARSEQYKESSTYPSFSCFIDPIWGILVKSAQTDLKSQT